MKSFIFTLMLLISSAAFANSTTEIFFTEIPDHEYSLYTEESHPQLYCLALNIYHEARSDNMAGQYAVADVVLNRVIDARFPLNQTEIEKPTVCDIVHDAVYTESGHPKRNRCQFSWYCDGKKDDPAMSKSWHTAQIIAYQILQLDYMRGITEGANHYHATYVAPDWSLDVWNHIYQPIGRIGDHLFYRWIFIKKVEST